MNNDAPIIVFGAPRSGTTYLNEIMNRHPEVYISHETRLFAWLHESFKKLPAQERFVVSHRDQFVQYLRETYPPLIRGFYAKMWPRARYWGDKNPHYADPRSQGCLDTIAELFPAAKFIHLIRDGRDVVASLLRKHHADGRPWANFASAHRTWVDHVKIGCEFGATVSSERCLEVHYEELIHEDVRVARQIFAFLNIPFDPSIEEFCRSQQQQRTPFSGPTRDLSVVATGSDWTKILTPQEQLEGLAVLGPTLIQTGYETEASIRDAIDSWRTRVQ